MSSPEAINASVTDWSHGEQDLGPLAWVLDELRKSLDGTVKAMRRFVRDAEIARESDLASLDVGPLRIARQQLHQASGALDMVGMVSPALILRALESAVQKYVQRPELCTDEAANAIERSSFALIAYLESVLAGKQVSAVALFPQYREAQALNGVDRVHPADLWPVERRFREPELTLHVPPVAYGPEARARLDSAVLRIIKSGDQAADAELFQLCLGFAAGEQERQIRAFWKICAGFYEALVAGLLKPDVYVKRVASRVLLQYTTLAKGEHTVADRLVHELLFFCAQAKAPQQAEPVTEVLDAVRLAFGLQRHVPVDYNVARFGLYDPALLAQARKRIATATETWSALAGGDRNKLKPAADQFSLVCDSLRKLHPGSELLAVALQNAVDFTARSGEPPAPALAMEVATAVLYLQASFEELDVAQDQMGERAGHLAQRLDGVVAGGDSEPLEPWMEDLYRRVSDHQTMGSVVDELRATLADAEKSMDEFFRKPEEVNLLTSVPGRLSQMRGVLSVLGLDQASQAVLHMRDTVERLLTGQVAEDERHRVFDKLGNSLGSLGFLIDMLSYQRIMARKLFVYDEASGELRLLMGRARQHRIDDHPETVNTSLDARGAPSVPTAAVAAPVVVPASPATVEPVVAAEALPVSVPVTDLAEPPAVLDSEPAAPAADEPAISIAVEPLPAPATAPLPAPGEEDDELLQIFLEEAREVIGNGTAAIATLHRTPADLSEQTTLRRAFHTLKGSSRMVGLNEFGEAAWSLEQMLNAWLAEQRPVQPDLLMLSQDSLSAFGRWVDDIAAGNASAWSPAPFRASADAMRLEGQVVPLVLAQAEAAPAAVVDELVAKEASPGVEEVASPSAEVPAPVPPVVEFDLPELSNEAPAPAPVPDVSLDLTPEFEANFDLGIVPEPVVASEPVTEAPVSFSPTLPFELELSAPSEPATDQPASLLSTEATEEIDFAVFEQAVESFPAPSESADPVLDLEPATLHEVPAPVPVPDLPSLELPPVADTFGLEEPSLDLSEFRLPDLPVDAPVDVPADASADAPADVPQADVSPESEPEFVLDSGFNAPQELPPTVLMGLQDLPPLHAEPEQVSEPEPVVPTPVAVPEVDDSVKVIGDLRISMPLYNVYLGEAEEWSQKLINELQAWRETPDTPVPEMTIARAHSLAGSSATVGFAALSELARTLEHALQHVTPQQFAVPAQLSVFQSVAEDIRRLLHQFAAGFLKEPGAHLIVQLQDILNADLVSDMAPLAVTPVAEEGPAEVEVPARETTPASPSGAGDAGSAQPEPVRGYVAPALSVAVPQAAVQSVQMAQQADDDIDALDVIDPDLFPIFEEEAVELLPTLGSALRHWSTHPENLSARSDLLRALHTLKGSARLAGAMRLGEMAHRMESDVEHIDKDTARTDDIEPLLGKLDRLQEVFDNLRNAGAQPLTEPVVVPAPPHVAEAAAAQEAVPPQQAPVHAAPAVVIPTMPLARPLTLQAAVQRVQGAQTVRVRSQLLDRLVNQAGEVMIARSRLDSRLGQMRASLTDLTGNLERLRQQLRDIEVQAESQMQSRLALSKDTAAGFDPLEFDRFTRVQELTRMMAESVNDVATVQRNLQRAMEGAEDDLISQGRQARELQRDLLRTRMVEFESISERLYALVRQSSKETGKQIKLDIHGGSIEMDRGVLDRMTPAFEHLLRNCVGHGIETPEARANTGKPAVGTISIYLRQEGNDVSVEFRDDGAGLNVERIREKAVERGLITADMPVGEQEAANLIFMPGFSTAAEVTGLSGRGIGMDVVRTEVNSLGGRIETSTTVGQGSSFRLILPLTTAVTQVVMLRAGNLSIGVPASVVEVVRRTTEQELAAAYGSQQFEEGSESLPFFWAGALLQSSRKSHEAHAKIRPVVILRSASQRIAMHVDEVLGNQEVVVKNLGPQLSRLPGMAGMSVLASGAVVLIYNPVALANVYGSKVQEAARVATDAQTQQADTTQVSDAAGGEPLVPQVVVPSAPQVPLVLVVDDSITVRRVTQRLLQREGYRVSLAADGLQALERLAEERPTVVLSDIEMPRMDGFDLARNIRSDARWRELPIIMITSRIAEKHREHAMELGVNHYLGKPYSDEELLSLIQHYSLLEAQAAQA